LSGKKTIISITTYKKKGISDAEDRNDWSRLRIRIS
jgi:hypothetical protein